MRKWDVSPVVELHVESTCSELPGLPKGNQIYWRYRKGEEAPGNIEMWSTSNSILVLLRGGSHSVMTLQNIRSLGHMASYFLSSLGLMMMQESTGILVSAKRMCGELCKMLLVSTLKNGVSIRS
jgi:hypothetical protein